MKVSVVVPNWNGEQSLPACLDALKKQTVEHQVFVVDNGSTDGSKELLYGSYPDVTVIPLPYNTGFAGGVNAGLREASLKDYEFSALLNNDAVPERDWLSHMLAAMKANPHVGIVTPKMISEDGEYLDSTGEMYSVWGLAFPRGRREADLDRYDKQNLVFGASGGASLYRHKMLDQVGLFDEDFFAYYEDVDLSFRAQLAGWQVYYQPTATVKHHIGATSGTIRGFHTYHSLKNLPLLAIKNVPRGLLGTVLPRLTLAYVMFFGRALARANGVAAFKGLGVSLWLLPKKLFERRRIQADRKVSARYINSIMFHDLPPGARGLRSLRVNWWRIRRKKV